MPLISYAPGGLPGVPLINSNRTVGPTSAVTKAPSAIPTLGTIPANQTAVYPLFNATGRAADAGEVADCFNQLVSRIQALEAILGANSEYGIFPI